MSGFQGVEKLFLDPTVLLRPYGSRIYVHVGVNFDGSNLQTGHLEQKTGGGS